MKKDPPETPAVTPHGVRARVQVSSMRGGTLERALTSGTYDLRHLGDSLMITPSDTYSVARRQLVVSRAGVYLREQSPLVAISSPAQPPGNADDEHPLEPGSTIQVQDHVLMLR